MSGSGPNSPEGKAIVAGNAIRHGLRARNIVLPDVELCEDWEQFQHDLLQSLAPEGAFELGLAERITEMMWRGRRVALAERDIVFVARDDAAHAAARQEKYDRELRQQLDQDGYASVSIREHPTIAPLVPPAALLQPIARYEAHINRQLFHFVHELEAAQERRRGNHAPLARIDIHGMPGT